MRNGEQVTTPYLSETVNTEECVLSALAPLGITTAIVAAIRVPGSSVLRATIGSAKETRGNVETDSMPSTSLIGCVRIVERPGCRSRHWDSQGSSARP